MRYEVVINFTDGTQKVQMSDDFAEIKKCYNNARKMVENNWLGCKNVTLIDWETYSKISHGE
ncbi:MAG: hypothetical protein MJZ37_06420 [Bacilli bacterium]|nr:hypothetical protein [Bacilli bacterium]